MHGCAVGAVEDIRAATGGPAATGAHEPTITTITHDHADRVRSCELLAEQWHRR